MYVRAGDGPRSALPEPLLMCYPGKPLPEDIRTRSSNRPKLREQQPVVRENVTGTFSCYPNVVTRTCSSMEDFNWRGPIIERYLCQASGATSHARLGAVSCIHRFGSARNRPVHDHCGIMDGVLEGAEDLSGVCDAVLPTCAGADTARHRHPPRAGAPAGAALVLPQRSGRARRPMRSAHRRVTVVGQERRWRHPAVRPERCAPQFSSRGSPSSLLRRLRGSRAPSVEP
jgi:hypothetical protein